MFLLKKTRHTQATLSTNISPNSNSMPKISLESNLAYTSHSVKQTVGESPEDKVYEQVDSTSFIQQVIVYMQCNALNKQALWFYVGKHIRKRILFMRSSRIEQPTIVVANITHLQLPAVYLQFQRSLGVVVFSAYVFTVYVNTCN